MTLIDDLNEWYKDQSYPPDFDGWIDAQGITLVESKDIDQMRWGTAFRNIYSKNIEPDSIEYAAVEDVRPATEMQDWGDYGPPSIYKVIPYEQIVRTVVYEKDPHG